MLFFYHNILSLSSKFYNLPKSYSSDDKMGAFEARVMPQGLGDQARDQARGRRDIRLNNDIHGVTPRVFSVRCSGIGRIRLQAQTLPPAVPTL